VLQSLFKAKKGKFAEASSAQLQTWSRFPSCWGHGLDRPPLPHVICLCLRLLVGADALQSPRRAQKGKAMAKPSSAELQLGGLLQILELLGP